MSSRFLLTKLRYFFTGLLWLTFINILDAQEPVWVRVSDKDSGLPLEAVSILVNGNAMQVTAATGLARLFLTPGSYTLGFTSTGYDRLDSLFAVPCPDTIRIRMSISQKALEDVTVLSTTRNNQRIENSPLKVEVLGREEMEEESAIKPGGIASILGDISGVQIQQSSAVSGNANVRIQGLDGRYTQILKDGMPLYDGFSGGFGILSIPPLDLKQIELIKGSASTLYGGGAIGGLINIISRRPTAKQESVLSINQTTLKETNFNTYFSKRGKKAGYTFFGGYNEQQAVDVNKDGFSDVPDLNGLVLHPRIFFYPGKNTTIIAGYTGSFEKRKGGDMRVLAGKPDSDHRYYENNVTDRNSFEFSVQQKLKNRAQLDFRSTASQFKREIGYDGFKFTGSQFNYYTELSYFLPYKSNSLVAGLNATGQQFKTLKGQIALPDSKGHTLGLFIQHTWQIREQTSIEAGIREDHHDRYGNFLLPRLAFFHRFNDHWATRFGLGLGYKIPDPLAPQNAEYEIYRLHLLPDELRAERSVGYNAEINYKTSWGDGNEFFINHAFFLTQLNKPLIAFELPNNEVFFVNQEKPVVTGGYDTYISAVLHEWELYAGYTYTVANRKYLSTNQFMPLTPRNRFAFTLVRVFDAPQLRFGLEGSYTGSQYREDFSKTPGYLFLAAMIEKKIGHHLGIVLNGENLLDFRQSRKESLYTGPVNSPVFKPLWGPIDGRVINLSIKYHN